jgi:hypothetical protein
MLIKEQVGDKWSTVCTHGIGMPTVLKNTPTKDNRHVVNQKLEQVDDFSFRELIGSIK